MERHAAPSRDDPPPQPGPPPFDWTTSNAKWGAVGLLALLGCAALAWSIIRGEAWNSRTHQRPRERLTTSSAPVDVSDAAPPRVAPQPDPLPPLAADQPESVIDRGETPVPPSDPTGSTVVDLSPPQPGQLVNINLASQAQLQLLPGIGPSRAQAIVEDRRRNGHFRTIDELDRVRGIGPAIIDALRDFATVN